MLFYEICADLLTSVTHSIPPAMHLEHGLPLSQRSFLRLQMSQATFPGAEDGAVCLLGDLLSVRRKCSRAASDCAASGASGAAMIS